MYEALVARVRYHIQKANFMGLKEAESTLLLGEAADAIEQLEKALNAVNDAHNEGYDVGYWAGRRDYEPKWIPVTDKLPESGGSYIVYLRPFKGKTDLGYVIGDLSYPTEMYFDKGQMLWVSENESYNAILSAVDTENEYHVTHWMPLPQPPKEE